jgi:hypothetical protein
MNRASGTGLFYPNAARGGVVDRAEGSSPVERVETQEAEKDCGVGG